MSYPDPDNQSIESDSEDDAEVLDDEDEDEERNIYDRLYRDATSTIKDRKGVFTEKDATVFLREFGDWAEKARDTYMNPLHAIVELLHSNDIPKLDDVLPLAQQLVLGYPDLLWSTNDQEQNPVFFALKKQRPDLVKHMLKYSEGKDRARVCMVRALERPCEKEKNKTCLHLALETSTKARSSLVVKLIKFSSTTGLKATDIDNKTPLHYAVNYSSCGKRGLASIIDAFLERDMEAVSEQRKKSSNQPLETFLDVKVDEANPTRIPLSVYQEHIATAEAYRIQAEKKKPKDAVTEGHAKRAADEGKTRNATLPIRSDHEAALRQNDPAKQRVPRELKAPDREDGLKVRERNKERTGDMTIDERERMRQQLKEEERRMREEEAMHPPETRRKGQEAGERREQSRDRAFLAPEPARQVPLHLQTGLAPAAVGRPGGERAANTPIKRVPTMMLPQVEPAVKETVPKETVQKEIVPKATVEKAKLLAESSKSIIEKLKLHYMRTRDIQRASSWLYGTNPKEIFFDYKGLPEEIPGELIKKTFESMHFDDVLMYVRFTKVTVRRRPTPRDKAKEPGAEPGRRDMEFFFDWLHSKGVQRILKLTVEEKVGTAHSDEAIKTALQHVVVEHLDWQKVDMDPEIICGISGQVKGKLVGNGEAAEDANMDSPTVEQTSKNELRVLNLMWSGSNAALRGWSEPHGLPRLQYLEKVNIIVPENVILYDSEEWIEEKINAFRKRLNKNINKNLKSLAEANEKQQAEQEKKTDVKKRKRQDSSSPTERHVSVSVHGISSKRKLEVITAGVLGGRSLPGSAAKVYTSHEWMECMERFAQNIKPFWEDMLARWRAGSGGDNQGDVTKLATSVIEEDVVVALIDDGVVSLSEYFAGRVLEGKTFDYHDGVVGQYYNSHRGHGTAMAKLILRVCPMAKIYPIRLKMHLSAGGETNIDLESAALAINAAREKNARIISMSWSIPIRDGDENGTKPLIENAIKRAVGDQRIMFCSSPDKGDYKGRAYPSYKREDSMFRIGAAGREGKPFAGVEKSVDYICPGVNVDCHTTADVNGQQNEITGSSVATALAAGLAATIVYCFKTVALATKIAKAHRNPQNVMPSTQFTEEHIRGISEHTAMKIAFENIGFINDARFIQVWDLFDASTLVLDDASKTHEEKVESIIRLCTTLMHRWPAKQ